MLVITISPWIKLDAKLLWPNLHALQITPEKNLAKINTTLTDICFTLFTKKQRVTCSSLEKSVDLFDSHFFNRYHVNTTIDTTNKVP